MFTTLQSAAPSGASVHVNPTLLTPPASGKGTGDENFPVASRLLAPEHRPAILAFYAFARAADDVADAPGVAADDKLRWLDAMEAALNAGADTSPAGRLGRLMREQRLDLRHPQHLLQAFRQDVRKDRYRNWSELLLYCRFSAAPVGRFVLDVHGAPQTLWPQADALCMALQILNHIQDCKADYQRLNRVYLPQDWLQAHGASVEMLAARRCTPPLRQTLDKALAGTAELLAKSQPLPAAAPGQRLQRELAVIQLGAERLLRKLQRRDPLRRPVKLSKAAQVLILAQSVLRY
jgi:hydroxysqualene synthase